MHGYLGRILRVDLSRSELSEEALNEDYARSTIGASGLAARYLSDVLDADTDPLGPDNPLLFLTGPLVGTSMTSAGRYCVSARSPLTGIWGRLTAAASSVLSCASPAMTACGSAAPRRARCGSPLSMGMLSSMTPARCGATISMLRRLAYENPWANAGTRGLHRAGGEHQVKLAGIGNDHGRFAARTGLGAVMGSKKLKAIAVRGTGRVPLYDPDASRSSPTRSSRYSRRTRLRNRCANSAPLGMSISPTCWRSADSLLSTW